MILINIDLPEEDLHVSEKKMELLIKTVGIAYNNEEEEEVSQTWSRKQERRWLEPATFK